MERGLVHLYTGDGKGKTTAAAGLTFRAVGNGLRCVFAQFLKGQPSGEIDMLKKAGVTVLQAGSEKFFSQMTEEEKKECVQAHLLCYNRVKKMILSGKYDLVVLDEVTFAAALSLIPAEDLCRTIDMRPPQVEIVLTGRDAPEALVQRADYLSEIRAVRHPYNSGVFARKGIEY